MSPIGRPFIDSKGVRGRPKKPTRTISGKLQFGEGDRTHILLILPDGSHKRISKENGIRLAHWLLDKCSRS